MKKSIFIVLLSIVLCSCGSVGQYKIDDQQGIIKSNYDSLYIVVNKGDVDISEDKMNEIKGDVVAQLILSGKFQRIVNQKDKSDLALSLNLTKYRVVSPFLRSLMWMAAGSNQIGAHVIATNGRDSTSIITFEAYGQSSAHPFSPENSYYDALRQFSHNVSLGLNNR